MKKTYEKPGLYVENFGLSQSIARSCGVDIPNSTLGKPTHADPGIVCYWDMGVTKIWTMGAGNPCTNPGSDDFEIDGFCYNAPSSSMTIFAS